MSLRRRCHLAALALVLSAGGCDRGDESAFRPRTPATTTRTAAGPVVGLVGTMSGPDAWRGDDAFEGADLGVSELNRALSGDSAGYELVTLDDEGSADRAGELVERLAGSPQTTGIVYAGPPEGLPRAEPALAEAGVPAILCYGDLGGGEGAHLFQASPTFRTQARALARYVAGDRRYRRVGILAEDSADGQAAGRAVRSALRARGVGVGEALEFGPGHRGLRARLRMLRRARVEAIVVRVPPPTARALFDALRDMEATHLSSTVARASSRRGRRRWRPQVLGFDLLAGAVKGRGAPTGAIAADSYARGAHYLPVPSFRRFRADFTDWWNAEPLGWERRAYEAVMAIGWAADRTGDEGDVARSLERLEGRRFGGLDITLTKGDHDIVESSSVGLWVSPRRGAASEENFLPAGLPWVPLARSFTTPSTFLERSDERHLLRRHLGPGVPVRVRFRFGDVTGRSNPLY